MEWIYYIEGIRKSHYDQRHSGFMYVWAMNDTKQFNIIHAFT